MQCERLVTLSKAWFLHVKDETMAPARMVQFIKDHVSTCDTCLADPDIHDEIDKITEIILPESKIPKAVRLQQEKDQEEAEAAEREAAEEEVAEDGEKDEYMDDDEDVEDDELNELDK